MVWFGGGGLGSRMGWARSEPSQNVAALGILGWSVRSRLSTLGQVPIRHEWHDDGGSCPPDQ